MARPTLAKKVIAASTFCLRTSSFTSSDQLPRSIMLPTMMPSLRRLMLTFTVLFGL